MNNFENFEKLKNKIFWLKTKENNLKLLKEEKYFSIFNFLLFMFLTIDCLIYDRVWSFIFSCISGLFFLFFIYNFILSLPKERKLAKLKVFF